MANVSMGKLSVEIGGDTSGLDKAHSHTASVLKNISANFSAAAESVSSAVKGMASAVDVHTAIMAQTVGKNADKASLAFRGLSFAIQNWRLIAVGALAAVAAIATIKALDDSVKSTITTFEGSAKAARNFAVSVESLSRLEFAARATGASAETLRGGLDRLIEASRNLENDTTASTRALAAMGIRMGDLTAGGAPLERALTQIASKFSLMEDGPNKAALATALFGDKAKEIVPFLDRGAAGIAELTAQADKFGGRVSGELAKQSAEYTDNMRRLGLIMGGVSSAMSQELIPVYNRVSAALVSVAEKMNLGAIAGGAMRTAIGTISTAVQGLLLPLRTATEAFSGILNAAVALARGDMAAAAGAIMTAGTAIQNHFKNFGQTVADNLTYVSPALTGVASAFGEVGKKMDWSAQINKNKAPIMQTVEAINEAKRAAEEWNRIAFMELTKETSFDLSDKLILLKMHFDAGTVSLRQYQAAVMQAQETQTAFNQALGQMTMQDLLQNRKLPIAEKVEELNRLVREGQISWREYEGAIRQTTDSGAQATDALLSTMSQALTTIFQNNKTAAIASALINTYQGVTKALAQYPPPFSYAMAGLQVAMGMAQVRNIQNTSKNSRSGSAGVSGAAGAAAASSAPASAPRESTLFVQGIDPRGMFSGEVVRTLATKLLDYQRDGGRVILAGA